jgi:hypothetical protein
VSVKFSNTNPAAPGGMTLVEFQKDASTGEVSAAYSSAGSGILLQTDGVDNGDQAKLDLKAGTGVTLTDDGVGGVTIDSTPGTTLLLQTDGVDNGSQTKLDLKAGTNVTLTDDGVGGVTIDAASSGGTVTHTGLLTADQVVVGNGTADVKILAGPTDATKFLNGAATPAFAQVKDSDLSLTNITTNDVTSTKHGFAPVAPADVTKFMNGAATPAYAQVKDSDLSTTNISTNDVTSTKHGFAPVAPADATKFLNGAATPAYAAVKDSDLSLSNITTNDVSTTKHGFCPIAPNDATKFLDGTGAFSQPVPRAAGTSANLTAQNASIGTTNLLASAPAGLYRISYYLNVTQAATTSSSILLTLTFTDGSSTSQSFSTPAIVKNTVGYFISDSIVIESGASQNIAYATTYASVGGTALNYSLRVHLELI